MNHRRRSTRFKVHGICDVHRLVDGDAGIRKVLWCKVCQAWICDECRPDLVKRAKAMAIRLAGHE